MLPQMNIELTAADKCRVTIRALVQFLAQMSSHMIRIRVLTIEGHTAVFARKRHISVHFHVVGKSGLVRQRETTLTAMVSPLSMRSQVHNQGRVTREFIVTNATLVRSFTGVLPLVDHQSAWSSERGVTLVALEPFLFHVRSSHDKRFTFGVLLLVIVERVSLAERFIANIADKRLFPSVFTHVIL